MIMPHRSEKRQIGKKTKRGTKTKRESEKMNQKGGNHMTENAHG
jgi:hypothetical protein